jgi:hypothetical protein
MHFTRKLLNGKMTEVAIWQLEIVIMYAGVEEAMGIKARKRQIVCGEPGYAIREPLGAYTTVFDAEIGGLNHQNTLFLDENDVNSFNCSGPIP